MMDSELVKVAKAWQQRAVCPYSHYRVGAAVLCSSGRVYAGCNIETANYSNTLHAEETAVAAALIALERPVKIAVATTGAGIVWPCGMCRQTLYELCGPKLIVVASNGERHERMYIRSLLPKAFGASDIEGSGDARPWVALRAQLLDGLVNVDGPVKEVVGRVMGEMGLEDLTRLSVEELVRLRREVDERVVGGG